MALVNVAAEIARRGKRVLVVDFDLEAPGLDTFDITRSDKRKRGLLDFVCNYRKTEEVPDVREFVYKSKLDLSRGELWVMPAGLQDEDYHKRFRSVDWEDLYSTQHGFLLFEDLKAQWERVLQMDYVLIDSRTGHTDVAGICTRQMPNAVVTLFFPNEQNRRGLVSIIPQIRAEAKGPLKKKIDLHFVMSNVPDLDDEDEILENEIGKFESSLDFTDLTAVIHHYDSLALLEQVTFTVKRQRSRLAKEYAGLAFAIIRQNIQDREGALAFLGTYRARGRTTASSTDLEKKLQDIRVYHSTDAEVLTRLASVKARVGQIEEALAIFTQALNTNTRATEILRRRARVYFSLGQTEAAVRDLTEIVKRPEATGFDLSYAIRMLRVQRSDWVALISNSPALDHLELDPYFIRELQYSPETLPLAARLISRWWAEVKDEQERDALRIEYLLSLIGGGMYEQALALFDEKRVNPERLDVPGCFNYAMALWGLDGVVPSAYLVHVAASTKDFRRSRDPNHLQCFSLVNRLAGNINVADELLERAREMILDRGAPAFSCWSYLMVTVEQFTKDLDAMAIAFTGGDIVPEFLIRNSQGTRVRSRRIRGDSRMAGAGRSSAG